ncbi:MAG: class I SAM-dependent methyltransferase [Christensenellaceae bacterium]|jgi:tRNA (adenine22-N1)-methyltransferase|nr:class I SAM-dependent methyltransferase [Christensenellaceae bacterium]
MHIHLRPRLARAADMLCGSHTAADIGCDHARLSIALLQQGIAQRIIASDISAASVEKGRALAALCGASGRITFYVAPGLGALNPGDTDSIAICGMGGLMILDMLSHAEPIAKAARRIVMQPQGNAGALRHYLYTHGYAVFDEAVVFDGGRYYQLLCARAGIARALPPGWPQGYYTIGPIAYEKREPNLAPMLRKYIAGHAKRLAAAQARGRAPDVLVREQTAMLHILDLLEEPHESI